MIFMALYIPESAYRVSSYLSPKEGDPEGDIAWKSNVLCCYTLLTYTLTILMYVLSFIFFLGAGPNDCSSNLTVLIIALVFMVVTACLRFRRNGTIFPGTLVNFWLALLVFTALLSKPDDEDGPQCNKMADGKAGTIIQTIGHFIMTFLVLYGLAVDDISDEVNEAKAVQEETKEK